MMEEQDPPLCLVIGGIGAKFINLMYPFLNSNWKIEVWEEKDGYPMLEILGQQAVAMIGFRVNKYLPFIRNLKLLLIPIAGFDWLDFTLLPRECKVCNTFDHEIGIAEFVLGSLLQYELQIGDTDSEFRKNGWTANVPGFQTSKYSFHGEIYNKTLGLVGLGHIGKEVAKRASAFGMKVIAVTRTQRRPTPENVSWVGVMSDFDFLLQESDYVVLACPLTSETKNLMGSVAFNTMKSSALVINVARGGIIDEQALYNALTTNQIRGAIIDTWWKYPLETQSETPISNPSSYPFHELSNVIMSPHCSGWTSEMLARRFRTLALNLDRFIAEGPLLNIVERPTLECQEDPKLTEEQHAPSSSLS